MKKNADGETAIDAAPVMLANRIKTWLEEHA